MKQDVPKAYNNLLFIAEVKLMIILIQISLPRSTLHLSFICRYFSPSICLSLWPDAIIKKASFGCFTNMR